jgi:hypothetical protein
MHTAGFLSLPALLTPATLLLLLLLLLAGSCKVGGAESNCQGSGVIIDNGTVVADGAVTAFADCVEEIGNIYQVGC